MPQIRDATPPWRERLYIAAGASWLSFPVESTLEWGFIGSLRMELERRIHEFWFGAPGSPDRGRKREAWFKADDAFDAKIRASFLGDFEAAARGDLDAMAERPEGALALIILLDQFPRNMFRGSARAFAADPKALSIAEATVARGLDQSLLVIERTFVYLPYEHSERLEDQDRSVALYEALGDAESLDYAVQHRVIIQRFGRFPHRNAVLGRDSTPEEAAFLQQPGSSFDDQAPNSD
jgi:uncharacterized protein (DUF924 family)